MRKSLLAIFILYTVLLSLAMAELIRPLNESKLSHIHVLFQWEEIDNTTEYEFQLSTSENFSSILIDIIITDLYYLETEKITWATTYYWRVRPHSEEWIDTYMFSILNSLSSSNLTANVYDESQYAEGYTIFGSADGVYSALIDMFGNEIWNSGEDSIIYYNLLDDGQFFGAQYIPSNTYEYVGTEFSLTEGIKWQEPNDEFVHHEFMQLPWGDYMGIAHNYQLGPIHATDFYKLLYENQYGMFADGMTNEWPWQGDRLVIWDKDSKEIQWTWSAFDHFSMDDYEAGLWQTPPLPQPDNYFDWTHINAFYFDSTDNSIYISTRNLSRITKIQYPSGEIIWNMGHEMPSGDVDFGIDLGFSHQHSINLLDNGNILIFDNGKYSMEYWGAEDISSRVLEIEISENNGSYSSAIFWEYILPPELFGSDAGNVQKLSNGNYLITTIGNQGTSLEVNTDKEIVWEANYDSYAIWRATRIPSLLYEDIELLGCMDINACNFNVGSDYCWYIPEGACDCDGNVLDECGVCNGTGAVEGFHCDGTPLAIIGDIIPVEYSIDNIYPNPFNPITNITYTIPEYTNVQIVIIDLTGKQVQSIVDKFQPPGYYSIEWNAASYPSGMYIIKMKIENKNNIISQKIMLLK